MRDGSFLGVLAEREEEAIAAAAKLRAKARVERSPPVPDDIHAWLQARTSTERKVLEGEVRRGRPRRAA